jgi:hypothetical protein
MRAVALARLRCCTFAAPRARTGQQLALRAYSQWTGIGLAAGYPDARLEQQSARQAASSRRGGATRQDGPSARFARFRTPSSRARTGVSATRRPIAAAIADGLLARSRFLRWAGGEAITRRVRPAAVGSACGLLRRASMGRWPVAVLLGVRGAVAPGEREASDRPRCCSARGLLLRGSARRRVGHGVVRRASYCSAELAASPRRLAGRDTTFRCGSVYPPPVSIRASTGESSDGCAAGARGCARVRQGYGHPTRPTGPSGRSL